MIDIKVYINKQEVLSSSAINIADRDEAQIVLISTDSDYFYSRDVDIFLEDYKIPYTLSEDGLVIKSQANNLFRESFGYSNLRVYVDNELIKDLLFNVSTYEEKFKNIKDMMVYLLENNDRILDLCFSRTKYKAKNDGNAKASFDSVITAAENIVFSLSNRKHSLRGELRHRLELIKEDADGKNFFNVNPYDVIDNLDKLSQGYSPDSVTLLGKVYSMEGIQRENHINSYDLEENRVLLGGLVSIKEELLNIIRIIDRSSGKLTYDKEYKVIQPYVKLVGSFIIEDLYTQLTTTAMGKRIEIVLAYVNELMNFFQREIKVVFHGFIPPLLSPFARKSSFYIELYGYLNEWYALGSPDIGAGNDLTKIRSTAKIYELFTLYKLIDALHKDGWKVTSSIEHEFFKSFIPSQVGFSQDDSVLMVFYEKKIGGFGADTNHNDLVALNKNNSSSQYNYYNPDFVIMKNNQKGVSYYILDAKYSSSYTLKKYKVLDDLYEKYYSNLAVYNKLDRTLGKKEIKCVNAIYPFGDKSLTKWPSHLPKIIPDISSILLSQDINSLDKILSLINESV